MTDQKLDAATRLLNLVCVLEASKVGLLKDQILASVPEYAADFKLGGYNESLERKFERDKETLRLSGIQIQTWTYDEENNQETRYRISASDYQVSKELSLTAKEISLINLAGAVWQQTTLQKPIQTALTKLRSLGADPTEPEIGFAPRIQIKSKNFALIEQALGSVQITFDYLKPGAAQITPRRVEPLAILQFDSSWILYAYDLTKEAPRNFLIDRIIGKVSLTKDAIEHSDPTATEKALSGLLELQSQQIAVIEVLNGSRAANSLLNGEAQPTDSGRSVIEINYLDTALFALKLASFGPEVRVISPPNLRELVIHNLNEVIASHQ